MKSDDHEKNLKIPKKRKKAIGERWSLGQNRLGGEERKNLKKTGKIKMKKKKKKRKKEKKKNWKKPKKTKNKKKKKKKNPKKFFGLLSGFFLSSSSSFSSSFSALFFFLLFFSLFFSPLFCSPPFLSPVSFSNPHRPIQRSKKPLSLPSLFFFSFTIFSSSFDLRCLFFFCFRFLFCFF